MKDKTAEKPPVAAAEKDGIIDAKPRKEPEPDSYQDDQAGRPKHNQDNSDA